MIYLSGVVHPRIPQPRVGLMVTPDTGNRVPSDTWWALDNACFARPDDFSYARFERAAQRYLSYARDRCLFVVAPDVPFDADGTLARFGRYEEALGELGAPLAFVTQDGMGVEDVPWPSIAALFVGGSTVWKMGHESGAIIEAARERGHWVHMGRINSLRRLRVAASMGCDSADGTFLKYAPDHNWERLQHWLRKLAREPVMRLA